MKTGYLQFDEEQVGVIRDKLQVILSLSAHPGFYGFKETSEQVQDAIATIGEILGDRQCFRGSR